MTPANCAAFRSNGSRVKIAIIGTGIAGNVAAARLRQHHDITVFEAASYIGGHSRTVDVFEGGRKLAIDTGFIVFNERTYPHFISLLAEIGQDSQPTAMSFSVSSEDGSLEYNGSSIDGLFAQRKNLLRPRFYRMLGDILRFNRQATLDMAADKATPALGQYLQSHGYSEEFIQHYLVPMAAAIWSAEPDSVLQMPAAFLLRFFANHGLLQLRDRPAWHVISGGSREYVRRLTAQHRDRIRLNCAVRSVRRTKSGVEIRSACSESEFFDAVFFACHSDQALALLADPTPLESEVLVAMPYQENEAVLHTDAALMPRKKSAWAAWNYHLPADPAARVAVTYNMNILQGFEARQQYCVTLNNTHGIGREHVIKRMTYEHPVVTQESLLAQQRQSELNTGRSYYCGAYWRNGFHEDGVISALDAVRHFEECWDHEELHLRRAG